MTTVTPEKYTQCHTAGTNPITTMGEGEGGTNASGSGGIASLTVGLGILSAVLAILLEGVVLGWVWSCYRRRKKSGIHER